MRPGEAAPPAIPFTVLGGFLGAGKTTLLNHLLRHPGGERIAVLVNDFGDVSIDADLVSGRDGDTLALSNGCICCGLASGFVEALPALLRRRPLPDRVLVEASGVADPRRVAQYGTLPGFRLDAVVVLADAERIEAQIGDARIGPQVMAQLHGADLVVLSKADLVDGADLAGLRTRLAARLPAARILEAREGRIAPALVLGAGAEPPPAAAPAAEGDAPSAPAPAPLFETRSLVFGEPLAREAVERFVASLPRDVIRAKGILWLADAPDVRTTLHVVGSRWRLRAEGSWRGARPSSRLVLIAHPGGLAGLDAGGLGNASGANAAESGAQPLLDAPDGPPYQQGGEAHPPDEKRRDADAP